MAHDKHSASHGAHAHVHAHHGNGTALPDTVRQQMEASFGADFSAVRVHVNSHAISGGARAFTQGHEIHFAPGQFAPGNQAGAQLLGHELAHVVQQRQERGRRHRHRHRHGGALPWVAEAHASLAGMSAAAGDPVHLHTSGHHSVLTHPTGHNRAGNTVGTSVTPRHSTTKPLP